MERFVGRQNIEHYRTMIKNATDLERRGVFKKLLRDEEAKPRPRRRITPKDNP